MDGEGNFALLINGGRERRNQGRILSPIGGAFELRPGGKHYIITRFDAFGFEQHKDLRFRIPDEKQVAAFTRWFKARSRLRELTAERELREELIKEDRLLTRSDLPRRGGVHMDFVGSYRWDSVTLRDVPEKTTAYLIETFRTTIRPEAMAKLVVASRVPSPRIYFVSERDIRNGRAPDGTKIGEISKFVLPAP
jgi:hypothetical protein